MATAVLAFGLGNLFNFLYLIGKNCGFPFLVAYLFFIVLLGLPVMITEMSLGRKTRHDPVQAYADIHPHARIVGIFGVLAAFIILSYYSVIGGWIFKYIASYVTTAAAPDFNAFNSSSEPVIKTILIRMEIEFTALDKPKSPLSSAVKAGAVLAMGARVHITSA